MIIIDTKLVGQARSTDILAFLEQRHGFTFTHHGGVYSIERGLRSMREYLKKYF